MSIGDRIRQVRKSAGLTMKEFGDRIAITASSVSYMESDKSGVSAQTIRSISREFNVSEDWLRTGEGEMFLAQEREAELASLVSSLFRDSPDSFRRRLITVLLRFRPDGPEWDAMEKIVQLLQEKTASSRDAPDC